MSSGGQRGKPRKRKLKEKLDKLSKRIEKVWSLCALSSRPLPTRSAPLTSLALSSPLTSWCRPPSHSTLLSHHGAGLLQNTLQVHIPPRFKRGVPRTLLSSHIMVPASYRTPLLVHVPTPSFEERCASHSPLFCSHMKVRSEREQVTRDKEDGSYRKKLPLGKGERPLQCLYIALPPRSCQRLTPLPAVLQ